MNTENNSCFGTFSEAKSNSSFFLGQISKNSTSTFFYMSRGCQEYWQMHLCIYLAFLSDYNWCAQWNEIMFEEECSLIFIWNFYFKSILNKNKHWGNTRILKTCIEKCTSFQNSSIDIAWRNEHYLWYLNDFLSNNTENISIFLFLSLFKWKNLKQSIGFWY
jgi:hypothetical protein